MIERIVVLLAIAMAGVIIVIAALTLPIGVGFGTLAGVSAAAIVRDNLRAAHLSALVTLIFSVLVAFSGGMLFLCPAGILYILVLILERVHSPQPLRGPIASAQMLATLAAVPILFEAMLTLIFETPRLPGPHGFPPGDLARMALWSWILPIGFIAASVLGLIGAFRHKPLLLLAAFGLSLALPVLAEKVSPLSLLSSICFLVSSRSVD